MIGVVICDDQWIVCEGLEAILSADPEIEVLGVAHDGHEAIEMTNELSPDIVLMDLRMPGMNGIRATAQIKAERPETRVLVLTTYGADDWVFDAIRSGASGYLLKGTPRAALVEAVKGTARGETHVDPSVAGKLFSHIAGHESPPESDAVVGALSDRELDVLRLLGRGLTNDQIAKELFLSPGTVRNYVSAILGKLGLNDRTQAAVLAVRYGLVD